MSPTTSQSSTNLGQSHHRSSNSHSSDSRGGRGGGRGRGTGRGGRGHKFNQNQKRPDYILYRREQLPIYPRQIYEHHSFASLLHTTYSSFRGRREQLRKAQERIDKLARRRTRYGDPTKGKLIVFPSGEDEEEDKAADMDVDAAAEAGTLDPRERRRRKLAKSKPPSIRQQLFGGSSATDHTAELVGGVDLEALRAMDQADWATLERMRADLLADLFDFSSSSTVVADPQQPAFVHLPAPPSFSSSSSRTSQLSHIHKRSTLVATNDNKHDWIVHSEANPFPMFAHQPPVGTVALSALPAYDAIAQRLNAQAKAKREVNGGRYVKHSEGEEQEEDAMSVDSSDSDSDSETDDAEDRFQQAVNMWVPPGGGRKGGKVVQVNGVSGKVTSGAKWLPKTAGAPAAPILVSR